jgi:hypothetical protein
MPKIEFLDNPLAPDVFADSATGWFLHNGNVRITFESLRINHITSPGPAKRVVIGRLVMPIDRAEDFANGLLEFIKQQRALAANPPSQGTPTIQ